MPVKKEFPYRKKLFYQKRGDVSSTYTYLIATSRFFTYAFFSQKRRAYPGKKLCVSSNNTLRLINDY